MTYNELKEIVQYHCHLYYDVNRSEIDDKDFDKLYNQLKKIEKAQGWCDPYSPTLHVGGTTGKIKHPYKLYSLNKVYNKTEIGTEFTIETPKLDGANLTLIYKNNMIVYI